MRRETILIAALSMLLLAPGCTWHDDYRQRQPNVLGEEKIKSSNVSSDNYVNVETNRNLRNPPPDSMPTIDNLSKIPEINDGQ